MGSQALSGVRITTVDSLIAVGLCLSRGSAVLAQDCGTMECDPETWPDPSQFTELPAYCYGTGGPGPNVCTDDGCIIDVLVVYTAAARDAAINANTTIQVRIAQAVDAMNVAFVNSGIPSFVRLVGTAEVDYSDVPGGSVQQAVACLANPACMPAAHALRDELKADFVSLFVEHYSGGVVGYAGIPDSFNAVSWWYAASPGGWIFAHEMGHNLGAQHQSGTAPESYCHGYVRSTSPLFRTIVTTLSGGIPSSRIQYYSNPNVSINSDVPTGAMPFSNNALCIQVYAPVMASQRVSDCNLNEVCDIYELAVGTSQDCNNNDILDECDISSGTSTDCDEDGILDECEALNAAGACCLSNVANDCIRTPTEACCAAANGLHWYGLGSKCQTTDCSVGPMSPMGGP